MNLISQQQQMMAQKMASLGKSQQKQLNCASGNTLFIQKHVSIIGFVFVLHIVTSSDRV